MDQELKQRLIGASVIIALAIIFVPMLFDGEVANMNNQNISISIPEAGENNLEVKKFELDKPVAQTNDLPSSEAELIIVQEEPELVTTASVNVPANPIKQVSIEQPEATELENKPDSTVIQPTDSATTAEPITTPEPTNQTTESSVNEPVATEIEVTKPKPEVTLPTIKPEIANQVFRVKLGSFSQQANAERVKSALLQQNIKAIVEYNPGLKLYRVWSQEMYQNEGVADTYVAAVKKLNLNIGTPKVVTLSAAEVAQMASQGQMGWVVQLGSFSAQNNAIELRNKVKAAGFPGFVDAITNSSGQRLFRLRIGPLMQKFDAEKTQAEIKQKLKLEGLVKPHELGQIIN